MKTNINCSFKVLAAFMALIIAFIPFFAFGVSAEAKSTISVNADVDNATVFSFTDGGITASGDRYSEYDINDTSLEIYGSGTYVLNGSCTNGTVTVKKGTQEVYLVLNGLTLNSNETAAISCNKSSEVVIIAASGTVNTLSDSEFNNDEKHTDNLLAENAVIKCKDGSVVTLAGGGTLNVVSNGKNGIKSGATTDTEGEARLTITELTLNITANIDDGLKADQQLDILSGNITVSAADDAIKSELYLNIGAAGTNGPTINIPSSNEGIEAACINIYSGDITVHASDDGVNAANSDLTGFAFVCNIHGGNILVDAETGDGIDSNGTLTINGGNITVFSSARNDNSPLDSEGGFILNGGTVLAVGAGGMAQTPSSASQAYIVFGLAGFGGFGRGAGSSRPFDGSNGGAPSMPNMPNGAEGIGDLPVHGGSVGAGGAPVPPDGADASAPAAPDDGSGKVSSFDLFGRMQIGTSLSISAGDVIAIADQSGNILSTTEALRAASYVFYTSDALTEGESCTLVLNGGEAALTSATTASGGMGGAFGDFGGGQQRQTERGGNLLRESSLDVTSDTSGVSDSGIELNLIVPAAIIIGAVIIGAAIALSIMLTKNKSARA